MRKIKKLNDRKKYAKVCCLRSSPEDDNCPFILSNLTFAQFSNYLAKRTSRTGKHQEQVLKMSNALYEQSQSAIKHLFRMSKYKMHSSFTCHLKQFTKGIWWTVADKKKVEGDSMLIGKKIIDFNVYQLMCELFMREEGEEFIFARCFLTLEWNLMA
jgi:hypothetical protein